MKYEIPFNKQFIAENGFEDILKAAEKRKLSGHVFTHRCQVCFEEWYGFKKCLLMTSCTDALEMAAMLCGVGHGNSVIMSSFTLVLMTVVFVQQGGKDDVHRLC